MKKLIVTCGAVLSLLTMQAADITHIWTGAGGDRDWKNTANWDFNGIPVDRNTATAGLNSEEIIVVYHGSVKPDNAPALGGAGNTNSGTPRITLSNGSFTQTILDGFWGSSDRVIVDVADGAHLTLKDAGSWTGGWTVTRSGAWEDYTLKVGKGASLTLDANGGSLHLAQDYKSNARIGLASNASLMINGSLGAFSHNSNQVANEKNAIYLDVGARATARFGNDYPDLNAVNADHLDLFRGADIDVNLTARDNGDNTFTVTATQGDIANPGVLSYDTGYTILLVRNGMLNGQSVIVGASYEGTLLAIDYDGNTLWTNSLTGANVQDVWCDDLDGDGDDEVLTAVADGSVHCLNLTDGRAHWSQPFKPNDVPMNAVCTVRSGTNSKYIACGGYDRNLYYLDVNGNQLLNEDGKAVVVDSSTYSKTRPWGNSRWYMGRWIGEGHTVNFLRPIPQKDGTDHLLLLGTLRTPEMSMMYEFEPFDMSKPSTILPISSRTGMSPGFNEPAGSLNVADPDGDGEYSVFYGANNLYKIAASECGLPDGSSIPYTENLPDNTYRISYVTHIPDDSSYQTFVLCGNYISLTGPGFNTANHEFIELPHAFNDMWRDRTTGRILFSSAQSGGSSIHIIDPESPHWKQQLKTLKPPGKIQTIKDNYEVIKQQLFSFEKPLWERQPDTIIEPSGGGASVTKPYGTPLALDSEWTVNYQSQKWQEAYQPEPFMHYDPDKGPLPPHTLSKSDVLKNYFQKLVERTESGFSYRAGHGNNIYGYEPDVLLEVMDRNYSKNNTNITVMNWAEVQSISPDFKYVVDRLFKPVAEHALNRNGIISFYNKHVFWSSTIHQPQWDDFISGQFKQVFVPSMEESHTIVAELSLSGRIGLWASGCFDRWGGRTTRDMLSYNRTRERSAVMMPNHFLRKLVYNYGYGSTFGGYATYSGKEFAGHMDLGWALAAKGALFVPRREEIVSFSPVHFGLANVDERYQTSGNATSGWTVYYDEEDQKKNPMVFGRLEGFWMGGQNTEWDFSRYAAGVSERRLNFIPPYPHGMVLTTPAENGAYASNADHRNRLIDNLHPMYRDILKEQLTDGRDYLVKKSNAGALSQKNDYDRHAANSSYYQTVAGDINNGGRMLPVTVKGNENVGWVCAQTAPNHLRLTLVDSGFVNPKGPTATVTFNTVTPVKLTDVLSGEEISITGNKAIVKVPLGFFRFIDIELTEPFEGALVEQKIQLKNGRNLISLHVDPVDDSLESIFADVLDNVAYIRDSKGAQMQKVNDHWINAIGSWDVTHGYLVRIKGLDLPKQLTVRGYPVNGAKSISVEKGYTLMPYFPSQSMTAEELNTQLSGKASQVKGADGQPLPESTTLSQGDAFLIKSDKSSEFRYTTTP